MRINELYEKVVGIVANANQNDVFYYYTQENVSVEPLDIEFKRRWLHVTVRDKIIKVHNPLELGDFVVFSEFFVDQEGGDKIYLSVESDDEGDICEEMTSDVNNLEKNLINFIESLLM